MTNDKAQRSVLLIGKSQLVLDESVAGLRDLGYRTEATNDFNDITGRFDFPLVHMPGPESQRPLDTIDNEAATGPAISRFVLR